MCGIFCGINSSRENFGAIRHRGPDESAYIQVNDVFLGFHHLAIVHPTTSQQPIHIGTTYLVCNGEIYNSNDLARDHGITLETGSDCEIISHLYLKNGIEATLRQLIGEFAFIIYDTATNAVMAARDLFGVRPLFYGFSEGEFFLASEMKAIHFLEAPVYAFRPGTVMHIGLHDKVGAVDVRAYSLPRTAIPTPPPLNQLLEYTVQSYLQSDRPIGSFLSGGLDSSLITALLFKHVPNLQCFTIGLPGSPDVEAARRVASYIGLPSEQHHIVDMTVQDGLDVLNDVIRSLETYDVTTIRASIPQYLLARYVSQHTNVKVLFSGEGADELFAGYQYSKMAPSANALEEDTYRLLSELYLFDNLRTDRVTARWGLEVRVPFLNKFFVQAVLSYPSEERMCNNGRIEKKLLRDAFAKDNLLPDDVLYRRKEAFSDAVSSRKTSWFQSLQQYIDTQVSDESYHAKKTQFTHNPPMTKEAYFYRVVFDGMYPLRSRLIPHYWMPRWCGPITDPSATVLQCYEN